jgi:HlyD family secretion protein
VAEAEASAAEAAANAQRARDLQASGALSAQQINQYLTAERTAQARLEAQRAAAQVQELRLAQAQVLAPDDGVISARSATVGAVVGAGQELFRLIRQGRLEWRAEVSSTEPGRLKAGQTVRVHARRRRGRERARAHGGADRGPGHPQRPGLRGPAQAGRCPCRHVRARRLRDSAPAAGLTLPQGAVLLRDGFSYVFQVGPDNKVRS